MSNFKRVMAMVLAVMMVLSLAVAASAADSPISAPTVAPTPTVAPSATATVAPTETPTEEPTVAPTEEPANPGYDVATREDVNSQDYAGKTVTSKLTATKAYVISVVSESGKSISFKTARNADNKKVAITHLGNGKDGIFNSKNGRKITTVTVNSKAAKVTISANTFKGSKVSKLTLASKKVGIRKNAFAGTKVKNPKIIIKGSAKTAKDIGLSKGAFTGLSKNAKIVVSKKTMTAKEFNKLKTKLKKAGFKGTVTRK